MPRAKIAKRVRTSDEFTVSKLLSRIRPQATTSGAYSWDLPAIMSARDQQIAGQFYRPAQLAISMRTDWALATAYKNRLAPARSLAIEIKPVRGGARAGTEAEALFGQEGSAINADTIADINGDIANHGIAIGYNSWLTREDGSRVDVEHHSWPIETVWWDSFTEQLMTRTATEGSPYSSEQVPIVHGDGRWVVYSVNERRPWTQDAAILPGGLVWALHAFASRDWAKGSASHGNAKVLGQLPEGVRIQEADALGNVALSPEATEFLALLNDLASLDAPVGIHPFGSKIDYLTNGSNAWEVWKELLLNAEKAAARIYLGTDGTLGAAGGAPGVDIATLFGVASTIIQGDLACITRGLRTGLIEPWAAINFGDSSLAPERCYIVPDPDLQQARVDATANEAAYVAAIKARRDAGLTVTQDWCDALAESLGVEAGELAATQTTGFQLAPTDLAKVITANEGRATVGLPSRDDGEVPLATFGQPAVTPPAAPLETPAP